MQKIWILFLIVFISCKKEELSLIDKWVLIDGQVYIEDLVSGKEYHYDHFGVNKDISYLTYINQPTLSIETIVKYKTTWEFKENGDFILNNKESLEFDKCGENYSILLNGVSRPFNAFTEDYKNGIIKVVIQEQSGSIVIRNIKWVNVVENRDIRWVNVLYFQQSKKISIN